MKQGQQLQLERCPHCNVAHPFIRHQWTGVSKDHSGTNDRLWVVYCCGTCGGMLLATSPNGGNGDITEIWPSPQVVPDTLPQRARDFLSQAISSLHAPSGAVMLTASAVDAMLKEKGYKTGSLNARIDQAAKDHLITEEMATWAHEIRLDANDQRHADETAPLPSDTDAKKVIEFANALAQFLFALPARVERGRTT